eukprot:3286406-Alexandrium_andersonii.AAC.1
MRSPRAAPNHQTQTTKTPFASHELLQAVSGALRQNKHVGKRGENIGMRRKALETACGMLPDAVSGAV